MRYLRSRKAVFRAMIFIALLFIIWYCSISRILSMKDFFPLDIFAFGKLSRRKPWAWIWNHLLWYYWLLFTMTYGSLSVIVQRNCRLFFWMRRILFWAESLLVLFISAVEMAFIINCLLLVGFANFSSFYNRGPHMSLNHSVTLTRLLHLIISCWHLASKYWLIKIFLSLGVLYFSIWSISCPLVFLVL